jgi:tetratricopeptide (TPR) repeat protein
LTVRPTAAHPAGRVPVERFTHDLVDIQDRTRALAEEERFTQAAELLQTALSRIGSQLPEAQILDLRLNLANLYLLAGAYRQALPEFERLAHDLADRPGVSRELMRHCWQQVATCQTELGELTQALGTLRALLADEQKTLPADAPEILDLHRQIVALRAVTTDTPLGGNAE